MATHRGYTYGHTHGHTRPYTRATHMGLHTWAAHMGYTHGLHTWATHMATHMGYINGYTHGLHTWATHMSYTYVCTTTRAHTRINTRVRACGGTRAIHPCVPYTGTHVCHACHACMHACTQHTAVESNATHPCMHTRVRAHIARCQVSPEWRIESTRAAAGNIHPCKDPTTQP